MTKNIFIASLLAAAALSPGIVSAQNTKLLTADKHNEYGLVYTLPVTALDIEVTARKTVRTAGPFYRYAKKYIGTDKVIKEDSEEWTITSVKVTPRGVPDNDNRFLMQLKPGAVTYICVDDDGMLLGINKEVQPSAPAPIAERPKKANPFSGKEYLQYVDEDFIASQSSAKQAQMLAESLMEVRDAKISLTRGTAETMPTDGRQLELMLNSLSDQEEALTRAFIGSETKETFTRTFSYTPDNEGRKTLFRMSDFAGFVDADDYSGDPVTIAVKITSEPQLPVDAKGEEKKLPKDAVIYNVPGAASVSIEMLGETLFSKEFEFAQFGLQFGLAPTLFSAKKDRSFAVFNPATGALMQLGEVSGE